MIKSWLTDHEWNELDWGCICCQIVYPHQIPQDSGWWIINYYLGYGCFFDSLFCLPYSLCIFILPYSSCIFILSYSLCFFILPYSYCIFNLPYLSCIFILPYLSCIFMLPYSLCILSFLLHIVSLSFLIDLVSLSFLIHLVSLSFLIHFVSLFILFIYSSFPSHLHFHPFLCIYRFVFSSTWDTWVNRWSEVCGSEYPQSHAGCSV